ncbi:hypothetical protein CQW23_01420 [Capsicum baccatum]|uniref:Uncharacterized protein n=1 Tax=Capsicum baccatum TaxID=33114 RepID=A0A2G2XNJ2_CAPBA|nr:hypothetical protein CQW23_01420 [Capsicum baccatum]
MAELLSRAMAVDDDMKEDTLSPPDLESIGCNESEDVLSPEDVAWADSCLISDLAILDHGMDSLKHALLDTFPSQTIFSAAMRDDSPQESHVFPTIVETGISGIVDDMIYDVSPTNEQEGNTTHHQINNKDADSFWSRINSEKDLFHISNEYPGLVEASDSEVDSGFTTFVEENLDDYIFKVWELEIPDEEDELVKQLYKALAGSSLGSTLSASEYLGVLDDKLLDDIIYGLDGLSLSPTPD